jgi:transposase-like protein
MRGYPQWRCGKLCYLWRAVDQEGEILEAVVTAKRDNRRSRVTARYASTNRPYSDDAAVNDKRRDFPNPVSPLAARKSP